MTAEFTDIIRFQHARSAYSPLKAEIHCHGVGRRQIAIDKVSGQRRSKEGAALGIVWRNGRFAVQRLRYAALRVLIRGGVVEGRAHTNDSRIQRVEENAHPAAKQG